jgi:hypothetical protein
MTMTATYTAKLCATAPGYSISIDTAPTTDGESTAREPSLMDEHATPKARHHPPKANSHAIEDAGMPITAAHTALVRSSLPVSDDI